MDLLIDNRLLNMSSFNSFFSPLFQQDKFDANYDLINISSSLHQSTISLELCIIAVIAAIFVGMAGMIPLMFIPFTMQCISSEKNESSKKLKLMLSFAVGGLLGDVFLHLLPEAWQLFTKDQKFKNDHLYSELGYWVLLGNATFILLQMIFTLNEETDNKNSNDSTDFKSNRNLIVAYLNLLANAIDNFSHGLAVGASFVINYKVGILTTIAIIFHEVPHEFADFAILIKSGISHWNAIKAQFLTASIGLVGTIFSLICESYKIDGERSFTSYILPFTAGGFLHIALTSILPELIKEDDTVESIKQFACIISGVLVMGTVNYMAA